VIAIFGKKSWAGKVILSVALLVGCSAALAATDPIKGLVRNQTRGPVCGWCRSDPSPSR